MHLGNGIDTCIAFCKRSFTCCVVIFFHHWTAFSMGLANMLVVRGKFDQNDNEAETLCLVCKVGQCHLTQM